MKTLGAFACVLLSMALLGCTKRSATYLIPDGMTGWFVVAFDQKEWPPLRIENGSRVFDFQTNSFLITSSKFEAGTVSTSYFWCDTSGVRRPLRLTLRGEGGDVWGGTTFELNETGLRTLKGLVFYIGNERDFIQSGDYYDSCVAVVREKLGEISMGPDLNK